MQGVIKSFDPASGDGIVMCDTINVDTHEPIEMDSRQMLKRQLARAEALGLDTPQECLNIVRHCGYRVSTTL